MWSFSIFNPPTQSYWIYKRKFVAILSVEKMPHKPGSFPCQNISPYRNESVSDSVQSKHITESHIEWENIYRVIQKEKQWPIFGQKKTFKTEIMKDLIFFYLKVKILGKKMTLKSTKLKSFATRFYKFPNDLNLLIRDQLYLFPSDPNQIFYGDKERWLNQINKEKQTVPI